MISFLKVICAFGRLGTMFGCDKYNIKPDLVSLAKVRVCQMICTFLTSVEKLFQTIGKWFLINAGTVFSISADWSHPYESRSSRCHIFSKQQARHVFVMLNVVIFQCPDLMKPFMILVFQVLSHMDLLTLEIQFHVL